MEKGKKRAHFVTGCNVCGLATLFPLLFTFHTGRGRERIAGPNVRGW